MIELLLSSIVGIIIAVFIAVGLLRRKAHAKRSEEQLKLALAEGQQTPMSLHPVIDATLCVGSFSCIKACPEGEIIGIVDGVATLVEAAHCIGHGTCAIECPVGAIKLVYGTAEKGIDLPESDDSFESSRPGVYIIGELGGMGLIKNALRQGLVVGKVLKDKLKKSQADKASVDVVIVGGGPAGVAAAISCKQAGLSVRVFEQESIGGTIAHYPRGKVVMTEQIVMPNYGPFGKSLLSKEDLLAEFSKLLKANKIKVEEGHKVEKIEGDAPALTVSTNKGASVQCRAVVLAIGLRGSPMKLGCPGEDMDKVTYRMIEPEQYHGQRVLVVGGGDSAVEAAIQLAEESTAKVSISYRQTAFTKAKKRNREKIEQLIAAGKVRALLGTKVLEIQPGMVRIGTAGDDKKGDKKDDKKGGVEVKRDESKRDDGKRSTPGREEPKAHGESKISLRPDTKLLPLDDDAGAQWPATRAVPLHGEASSDEDVKVSKGARRPEEMQRTMFISDEMKAEAQKGFKDEPSSISIRGGVRALDDVPSKSAAPGDFSGIVRIPAQKEKPRTGAGKRIQSVVSNLRAKTRVIVGGRAANIEDLEDLSGLVPRGGDSGPAPKTTVGVDDVKKEGEGRLKNDVVIVCIGGQLPTAFLNSIKVNTKRYAGEEKAAGGGKGLTKQQVEARSRRRLAMTLFALGGSIILGLLLIGQEYYWLPLEERAQSQLHPLLKPSGLWGHGVGVAATTFMLANFIYAARKRWSILKGTASIRTWLTFHMFVGIMSPLVIAFHAAFLAQNLLAVWTWVALSIVVATGIFGRFLFGLVPAQAGKLLQVTELRSEVADTSAVLSTKIAEAKDVQKATQIFNIAKNAPEGATLVRAMIKERESRKKLVQEIEEARVLFKDQAAFETYKEGLLKINRARLQISFYAALKRVFRAWLIVHVVIAIFMVFLIGAHVAVTAYLGFRWIFGEGM